MGQRTEFEEPEYEGPLYNQLLSGSFNLWTSGRVFERIFGIDAALFSNNHFFWSLFAQTSSHTGTALRNYNWRFLWRVINRNFRPFPRYKVNVLIQSKRPEHRSGINSAYSIHGIKGEYWQFKVTKHQQKILEQLELKLGNDALVVYACPVFHKFDHLDQFTENGQIVENSTFVKASALTNHSKWVFDKPGTSGLACSKIEKHSDIPFGKMLHLLLEHNKGQSNNKNLNHLMEIANQICFEDEQNPLLKAFIRRNKMLKEYFYSIKSEFRNEMDYQELVDFVSFAQFAATINVEWFTID